MSLSSRSRPPWLLGDSHDSDERCCRHLSTTTAALARMSGLRWSLLDRKACNNHHTTTTSQAGRPPHDEREPAALPPSLVTTPPPH